MWIYLNNSFLSIVAPKDTPDLLLVRGRREGDIEAIFPYAEVQATPHRDYAYRTNIARNEVEVAMRKAVQDIDYNNFKGSIPDFDRHDEYLQVWEVMVEHQYLRTKKNPMEE
jgi:hypothetical protein